MFLVGRLTHRRSSFSASSWLESAPIPPHAPTPADGRYFAVGREGGFVDLYRSSGELVNSFEIEGASPSAITGPSFTSDGRFVAGSVFNDTGTINVWSTESGDQIVLDDGGGWAGGRLVGDWLAVNLADSSILLVDPATSQPVGAPFVNTAGRVTYDVADPTGTLLAAPAGDAVTVWDIESGLQLGRELPASPLLIEFNADGTLLSVPGTDRITLWNYDQEMWPDLPCELAGRNLTPEEWDQFGPRTIDYRATCPQFGASASAARESGD